MKRKFELVLTAFVLHQPFAVLKFILLATLSLSSILEARAQQGQDPQADFRRALKANDTTAMRQTLAHWQRQEPKNASVYAARASYLLRKAELLERRQGSAPVASVTPSPQAPAFQTKTASATKGAVSKPAQPTVSKGPSTAVDCVRAAQATLQQGIALAPLRLDLRFALARSYEKTGQVAEQVRVLREALAERARAGKPWQWFDSAELPAPEADFVPASLEEYAAAFWQQGSEAALEAGKQVAELMVQYFPQSHLGPYNLGVYHGFKGQHQEAYTYLQQADKLDPQERATLTQLVKTATALGRKTDAGRYQNRLNKLPVEDDE